MDKFEQWLRDKLEDNKARKDHYEWERYGHGLWCYLEYIKQEQVMVYTHKNGATIHFKKYKDNK